MPQWSNTAITSRWSARVSGEDSPRRPVMGLGLSGSRSVGPAEAQFVPKSSGSASRRRHRLTDVGHSASQGCSEPGIEISGRCDRHGADFCCVTRQFSYGRLMRGVALLDRMVRRFPRRGQTRLEHPEVLRPTSYLVPEVLA